jgi:hypothetical protein
MMPESFKSQRDSLYSGEEPDQWLVECLIELSDSGKVLPAIGQSCLPGSATDLTRCGFVSSLNENRSRWHEIWLSPLKALTLRCANSSKTK